MSYFVEIRPTVRRTGRPKLVPLADACEILAQLSDKHRQLHGAARAELADVKESLDQANALRIENLDKGLDFARGEIEAQRELADVKAELFACEKNFRSLDEQLNEMEAERDRYKTVIESITYWEHSEDCGEGSPCICYVGEAIKALRPTATTTDEPSIPDFLLPWVQADRPESKDIGPATPFCHKCGRQGITYRACCSTAMGGS